MGVLVAINVQSVSVVIPTIGTADLNKAVQSALDQTHEVAEVIVVADTVNPIDLLEHPRVRMIRVGPGLGGNGARQSGIEASSGDLIALLDDDDWWAADKLELQLRDVAAAVPAGRPWFATTRLAMVRSADLQIVVPDRKYDPAEPLTHYLFRKNSVRASHGFIQASTLLFPRELANAVQFDGSLKFHQDISWLIDVARSTPDLVVVQTWEPSTFYNATAGSVSKRITPQGSAAWAVDRLGEDSRTLGDFILTQSFGFARRRGSVEEMRETIRVGETAGRPGVPARLYARLAIAKFIAKRVVSSGRKASA
jgi:glycosyltransferase involved in cell wall biosynthesis